MYILAGWMLDAPIKKYLHPDQLIVDDFRLPAVTRLEAEDRYEVDSPEPPDITDCRV
jgi:hypothetical protein